MENRELIPNGDFSAGKIGALPDGWTIHAPYPFLMPVFKMARKDNSKVLLAAGNGTPDCMGWISNSFQVEAGKTFSLKVRFKASKNLNPQFSLLFGFYQEKKFNDGIFKFKKLDNGWIEGENRFLVPGEGTVPADVRIYFRYSDTGKVWIDGISLTECEPVKPRYVRVACTDGKTDIDGWSKVLDTAGKAKTDVIVLPETFNGTAAEPIDGPSATLMSVKAKEHGMYVAGSFRCLGGNPEREQNVCLLFDRQGKEVGRYYKNHPWTPEAFEGVTPGTEVPVFDTDFGRVGLMICYDIWFTDVTELLALKGAEIILFMCEGYYHSLLPARTADNGVRMVCSSLWPGCGIWETTGGEARNPNADELSYWGRPVSFKDVVEEKIGDVGMLSVTLDLSQTLSPGTYAGPLDSAPGGRRNRREQKQLLYPEIIRELNRWHDE